MNLLKPLSVLSLGFTLAAGPHLQAQGYAVDATFSGQAAGDGTYNYTLTLNNEASALNSIGTFWFAWTDHGYDLLPSSPTVTGLPGGWSASVQGGTYYYGYPYPDGYSIDFTTSLTPLAPGDSLTFQFNSPDSPDALAGNSPVWGLPVGTSFVYSGGPFSDAGDQFLVSPAPVPEPSTANLLALGLSGLGFAARRRLLTTSPAALPTRSPWRRE